MHRMPFFLLFCVGPRPGGSEPVLRRIGVRFLFLRRGKLVDHRLQQIPQKLSVVDRVDQKHLLRALVGAFPGGVGVGFTRRRSS